MKIAKYLVIIIFFASCKKQECNNSIFEEYHEFKNEVWRSNQPVNFLFDLKDSTKNHDISLRIRYNISEYPFQNIILVSTGEFIDTFNIQLRDKHGNPKGKGVGDIREHEFFLACKKKLNYNKNNKLKIQYSMTNKATASGRLKKIKGINSLGLIILECDE
tara:strand:- start:11340 stop:11822 length:483 start_codon:yes stop_codon:yes gene_type:complete